MTDQSKIEELVERIDQLHNKINLATDFNEIVSLRKQLSLLILKKEVKDNIISGKWKNSKKVFSLT